MDEPLFLDSLVCPKCMNFVFETCNGQQEPSPLPMINKIIINVKNSPVKASWNVTLENAYSSTKHNKIKSNILDVTYPNFVK